MRWVLIDDEELAGWLARAADQAALVAVISTGLEAQLRDRRESVQRVEHEREDRNAAVRARRLRDRCR